jgi:hypothetical protein
MAASQGALGAAFKISRALQAACLVAVIGMTANFVSQIVSANATPPQILIATLSIVSRGWSTRDSRLIAYRCVSRYSTVPSHSFCSSTTSFLA